jgi:hypothetical protein
MRTTMILIASMAMFAALGRFSPEPGCHDEYPIAGLPAAAFTVCGGRP